MTYFLRHQCSCSWVENSSKTTPETPHRYSFDDERQHAMSRRNISRKRRRKKRKNTITLSTCRADRRQTKFPLFPHALTHPGQWPQFDVNRGGARSNNVSSLLLCVFVLKCKLCCYSSISLLSSSSNTNDFLVVSKSNDVTSVWNPHETLTRWMIFWERNFWSSSFYVKTETHFNCRITGKILIFQCLGVHDKKILILFFFLSVTDRKIPKISPEAYVFERLSLWGLFMQGLTFGGTNIWWEIYVTK